MFTSILAPMLLFGSLSGDELRILLHFDRHGDPRPRNARRETLVASFSAASLILSNMTDLL
jgi:hypothetical protein